MISQRVFVTYQFGLVRVDAFVCLLHVKEVFLLFRAWAFLGCAVALFADDGHLGLEELGVAALRMDKGDLLPRDQLLCH